MKTNPSLKILAAAVALTVLGCNQADPVAPAEPLQKSAATNFCPKFTNFMSSYAMEITQCSMSGQSCVVASVYNGFKPILECFGIATVSNATLDDLIALPDEIVAKSKEFETNPSKAQEFGECLCGGGFGGGSVGGSGALSGSFNGSTSGATGSFNGSTSGATGSFNGSTSGATGSFTGSTSGATSAFGK